MKSAWQRVSQMEIALTQIRQAVDAWKKNNRKEAEKYLPSIEGSLDSLDGMHKGSE